MVFGKLFGKKKAIIKENLKKFENRDQMEAMVGGCALIMYANGSCDEVERKKTEGILRTCRALEGFAGEVQTTLSRFEDLLQNNFLGGRLEILREIEDLKADQQAKEDVLVAMISVAKSDGEVQAEEKKIIDMVAQRMGLRVEDYDF